MVLVALACAVGVVATLVPVLPGTLLVGGAIVVWAVVEGGAGAWTVTALCLAVLVTGQVLKYVVPGKSMAAGGVPARTMVAGAVLGVVGFFVVPVIGLAVGFVLGVYLAEVVRHHGLADAWPSTVLALRAAGVSALIEFGAAFAATALWAAGVLVV